MARRRSSMTPALIGSLAFHGAIAALAFVSLDLFPKKPVTLGPVVPVTIIDGPPADLRPALAAEETVEAQAEAPDPAAEPAPPAPEIAPQPEPVRPAAARPQPKPQPTPPPKPAPAPARPAPAKPAPAKPAPQPAKPKPADKPFDLDALAASVASAASRKAPASGARQGPNRAETAPQAREGAGASTRLSASEADALRSKLEKLWNPNCEVEGGAAVVVKVRMRLRVDGSLIGAPEVVSKSGADRSVVEAAATRAVNAVGRGAPYSELSADTYAAWDVITFNFNAKQACARR